MKSHKEKLISQKQVKYYLQYNYITISFLTLNLFSYLFSFQIPVKQQNNRKQNKKDKEISQQSRRKQQRREPKIIENDKTLIITSTATATSLENEFNRNLSQLKQQFCQRLHTPVSNPINDPSEIQSMSQKVDASLFSHTSTSKKRPNNLVLGRCFDYQISDMYEFEIMKDTWLSLQDVHSQKPQIMSKPLLIFQGDGWELHQNLKELFMDLFKGHDYQKIAENGIQYCMCFYYNLRPESSQICYEGDIINVRTYVLNDRTEKSKELYLQTTQPESLTPMGFQFDLKRRRQMINPELIAQSKKFYQPKKAETKGQKNLEKDELGREFGTVYTNIGKMQDLHLRHAKLDKQIRKEEQLNQENQSQEYYEEYYEEDAE